MVSRSGSKVLLVSLLLGMVSVPCILKNAIAQVSDDSGFPPDPKEQVMCYDMAAPMDPPELRIEDYEAQLKSIEQRYKEGKISKETYETRKSSIQKEIELLKSE